MSERCDICHKSAVNCPRECLDTEPVTKSYNGQCSHCDMWNCQCGKPEQSHGIPVSDEDAAMLWDRRRVHRASDVEDEYGLPPGSLHSK